MFRGTSPDLLALIFLGLLYAGSAWAVYEMKYSKRARRSQSKEEDG